jgi:hypothetical protein
MRGCTGTPLRGPRRERQLWQPDRRPRVRLREPPRQGSAVALSACPRARRSGCPRSLCAGGCQREPWPRTAAAPARRNRQPRVRYVGGLLRSWSPGSPAHPAGSCARCRCQPHRWLCRLTPVRPLGRSCSPGSLDAAGRRRAPATVGGGWGTRLRRVLLRWQAPQPCRLHPGRPWPGQLTPTSSLRQPLRHSLRAGVAYLWPRSSRASVQLSTPRGGQSAANRDRLALQGEWCGRAGWGASRD